MDIYTLNNQFYDHFADSFDKIPFESLLPSLILKYIASSCNILEIGPGGGALALWMINQGHKVICVEPSEKLAKTVQEKGITVFNESFQDFQASEQYDAIMAISSLIHIPRRDIPFQIRKIFDCLNTNGIAILSFLEGNGEGLEDPTNKGKMRFFSKFRESEVHLFLKPYFSIAESHKVKVKAMSQSFILLILKKNDSDRVDVHIHA